MHQEGNSPIHRDENEKRIASPQRSPESADLSSSRLPAIPAPLGTLPLATKEVPAPAPIVASSGPPPLYPLRAIPRAFRSLAQSLREKYKPLYQEPVLEHADGHRSFHQADLYRRHGINVLFLKGDTFEMAFQHARLLHGEIRKGTIANAKNVVHRALANKLGNKKLLLNVTAEVIHRFLSDRIMKYSLRTISNPERPNIQEAIAISDSTGIPIKTLARSLYSLEAMLLLAGLNNRDAGQKVHLLPNVAPPVNCCSSMAAWGPHTKNGEILIGRNMDFPFNGSWDKFPTVIYFEPTDGSQRYMTFVSSGVHNAGMHTYNESGIYFVPHVALANKASTQGIPAFANATDVGRYARTFDEAIELFKRYRTPAGWCYFLVSVHEKRFATIDLSNESMAVNEIDPATQSHMVQSNHFLNPAMQDQNMFLNRSIAEDNDGRFLRMQQRILESKGSLDPAAIMSIMSDQVDPFVGEVRGLGATVGVHTNMTSLVLDPANKRVFMASGEAPVCHSPFVEFPLAGTFKREDFAAMPVNVVQNDHFEREHPEKSKALKLYIDAKIAYEFHNDSATAYRKMQEIVRLDRNNPAYFFVLGIFALKTGDPRAALRAFNKIFDCTYSTPQLNRLGHYYRGRTYAQMGAKQNALNDLQEVINDPDTCNKLRNAANSAFRKVARRGALKLSNDSLMVMMQWADMLSY